MLTTKLTGGRQSGVAIGLPFGTQARDAATLTGANGAPVPSAVGQVVYVAYSDAACVTAAAADTQNVANGIVPRSKAFTLVPGSYFWRAFYSGDSQNQPSSSPCQSEAEAVAGVAPKVSSCWKHKPPRRFLITQTDLGAIGFVAPTTVSPGQSINVSLPCDLPANIAAQLAGSSPKLVDFVQSNGKGTIFGGLVRYLNLRDFAVTIPASAFPAHDQASAARRPPKLPFKFFLLKFFFGKLFKALKPIKVNPTPVVTHPTCSGTVPSTFLIYPNHASSPGTTSLLLSCTLPSPAKNGFSSGGAWAPSQVLLYDYASFQNLTLVNGRLTHMNTFPVRAPRSLAFSVIGPLDIDVTLPSGLPSSVYIPVVVTGGADVPSSNVLNIP
jgi:hypothetical protein